MALTACSSLFDFVQWNGISPSECDAPACLPAARQPSIGGRWKVWYFWLSSVIYHCGPHTDGCHRSGRCVSGGPSPVHRSDNLSTRLRLGAFFCHPIFHLQNCAFGYVMSSAIHRHDATPNVGDRI